MASCPTGPSALFFPILTVLLTLLLLLPTPRTALAGDDMQRRHEMVARQIEARGVRDDATLKSMRSVERHRFVPKWQARFAYHDRALPIGHGQTISQPYIVAYMTEQVAPAPGRRILEIGTGSGYQAAVLAAAGATVHTIEIIPELAATAGKRLDRLGYSRVQVKQGDGYFGWPEHAPFDAIVVTAAAEFVPPPLLDQLAEGGVMVIPVGNPFLVQMLMRIERRGEKLQIENLFPVRFVPFRRAP